MKKRDELSRQLSSRSTESRKDPSRKENQKDVSRSGTTSSLLSNFRKLSKAGRSDSAASSQSPVSQLQQPSSISISSPQLQTPTRAFAHTDALGSHHQQQIHHQQQQNQIQQQQQQQQHQNRRTARRTSTASSAFSLPLSSNTTAHEASPPSPTHSRRSSQWTLSSTAAAASIEAAGPVPKDSWAVEQMFSELMTKRDFKSLPEAAKKQMKEYPLAKKWMLIHQDALSERKKLERTQQGDQGAASPETYVRLLMDRSISSRQLGNLWVSLRTEPVGWVQEFIDAQGPVALGTVLQQLHTRSTSDLLGEEFLEKEMSIIRCLRTIINSQKGADYALDSKICVPAITGGLISIKLATRRLVTDMLSFLAHCRPPEGYNQVLKAMNSIPPDNIHFQARVLDKRNSVINQTNNSGLKRFEQWLKIVEQTLEGRGKMGSMVGASDELRSSGSNSESQLLDYALATMVLINTIASGATDYKERTHIRAQLKSGGLYRIFKKFKKLNNDLINDKIREFEDAAAEDYETLLTSEQFGNDVNMNDPVSLIRTIWDKIQNSESEQYFLSAMQHLFLNQSNYKSANSQESTRSFRLLDGLISNITMNSTTDDDVALNVAIHRLYDGLQTDEVARRAIVDSREATKKAEEATAERDELLRQISLGSDGMLSKLKNELSEQEVILLKQRRLNESLSNELEELKRKHVLEKHEQELEMREMLIMLNNVNSNSKNNSEVVDRLKSQISSKKNQNRIDTKKWGSVEPNSRLRALRDQMEDIEQQARELEMTNFAEYKRPDSSTISVSSSPSRGDDLTKLNDLKNKLETLQGQSNDILKFDIESKNKELMSKQKMMAMDRLKELQTRFKNLNIDFSSKDFSNGQYKSLDPKADAKLHEELDEIERLSSRLQSELDLSGPPTSKSFLENLEAKYITGQKSTAADVDYSYRSTVADKIRRSSGFNPSFLNELKSTVGKVEPIKDDESYTSEESDGEISKLTKSNKKGKNVSQQKGELQPPIDNLEGDATSAFLESASPIPKESESSSITTAPPPPPAPPLPSNLNASTTTSSVPPPPPPPPPFPPMSGAVAPPPPPPPFPTSRSKSATPSPLLPQSPSLFERYPRPKKKLKQLHWEKIEATENSVWEFSAPEKIANDLLNKGIFDDLENIFAAREAKNLAKKKPGEVEKLTFLSRDISQQFQINLHMFSNLSEEQLVNKILRCDRSVLENSSVIEFLGKAELSEIPNGLARNLEPYRTDWTKGAEKYPEKDPNELQRADRIYLELFYNLQDYWTSRMRALKVITSFEKEYHDLVTKLRAVDEATEDIQNSQSLRKVFDIILAVGNFMNDTNKQAQGFKLSTLQRLTFMKNEKNDMTFLHYVEKIIRTAYPEVENFLEEIKKCLDVSKVSIEQLSNDSRDFSQSIKNVEASIDIGNLSDSSKFHPDDRVLGKVLPILPQAKRKSDLLNDQVKITISEFDKLMKFFGEDPNDNFAKNSFFKKFVDFINDFKKAQRENIAKEEEERIYEQRKRLMDTPKKSGSSGDADVTQDGDNVMDALLEKLKAAGPSKGNGSSARKRSQARKNLLQLQKEEGEESESDSDSEYTFASSDMSPTKNQLIQKKNTETISENTGEPSKLDNGHEPNDVGSRARNLLQELRGNVTSSTSSKDGNARAQLLRQQQRLKRKQIQPDQVDDKKSISETIEEEDEGIENSLSTESNETVDQQASEDVMKTEPDIENKQTQES